MTLRSPDTTCTRLVTPTGRRFFGCVSLATLVVVIAVLVVVTAIAEGGTCVNQEVRAGFAAALPDCRAYEAVSPLAKNGYDVTASGSSDTALAQASPGGDSVVYAANGAFPGAASGSIIGFYRASREAGDWVTQSLLPPQAYSYDAAFTDPVFAAYSPDLSKGALVDATDFPTLISGEQETTTAKTANLFVRDNTTGAYSLSNVPAPGIDPVPYEPTFDGASADFSTVIFDASGALTPEAPMGGVDNLYESTDGKASLVSLIPPPGEQSCGPNGPACLPAPHGGRFGDENAVKTSLEDDGGTLVRAISSDGSRVVFTSAEGNLYLRENGETTVEIDRPAPGGVGPGGGGAWATGAADGSKFFFLDSASAGLTADTLPGSGTNLYSLDPNSQTLTDLTPEHEAGVKGVVNEASQDGSYLYFVATGVLTGEKNSLDEEAHSGAENLYVSHAGTIAFLHTIVDHSGDVYSHALGLIYHKASRVTPDGVHIAFFAEDHGSLLSGQPLFAELYEYSANTGRISRLCECAGSEFRQESEEGTLNQTLGTFQYNRGLSDDGSRVFFESYDPLLNRDSNGQADVYEYERDGTGSCAVVGGCLSLVSTGTSANGSWFADASANGDDVFFTTSQQLVPSDTDGAYDLYDARVGGGPQSLAEPPACLGDACQPAPAIVEDATPASFTFSGAGNPSLPVVPVAKPAAKKKTHSKKAKRKKGANAKKSMRKRRSGK